MSEYDNVRTGKLLLKGEKNKAKKRKRKNKTVDVSPKIDKDSLAHGNWWKVTKIEEISGPVALEFGSHTYVKALDNGLFTLGAPHDEGNGPSPEEILTAVVVSERKVAFKSGYGKYLRVEKNGVVTGRADAIGAMEQWEPVFDNGKMALQSYNNMFVSVDDDEDTLVAKSKTAGPKEMLQFRSQTQKDINSTKDAFDEDDGNLEQVEVNYVRKFQKFQDKKLKICKEDVTQLKTAKVEGVFHETMLDRRSKMKADRYCK